MREPADSRCSVVEADAPADPSRRPGAQQQRNLNAWTPAKRARCWRSVAATFCLPCRRAAVARQFEQLAPQFWIT